jgi:nicotinamidase-related amidase
VPERGNIGRIIPGQPTAFVLVDFQEKFIPVIPDYSQILEHLLLMARSARILQVPILVTEQYPKGLGPTVKELMGSLEGIEKIEKTTFSCFHEPRFVDKLKSLEVNTLILGGVEAHVCVAQTALDALGKGYAVHILSDAVGSRKSDHVEIALQRLSQAGAVISCVEMAVFELMGTAGTPEFKAVQKLIKG